MLLCGRYSWEEVSRLLDILDVVEDFSSTSRSSTTAAAAAAKHRATFS